MTDNVRKPDLTPPKWDPIPSPHPKAPRKFYSPSLRGFFSEELHGSRLPIDAVEITATELQALLSQQATGKEIVPGTDGKPVATDPVLTPARKRQIIEAQIHQLRTAPDTLDAQRGVLLGKPGAKEALQAIDTKIHALTATLPPLGAADVAAAPSVPPAAS